MFDEGNHKYDVGIHLTHFTVTSRKSIIPTSLVATYWQNNKIGFVWLTFSVKFEVKS